MTNTIKMFSDGKFVSASANGEVRTATKREVYDHILKLASEEEVIKTLSVVFPQTNKSGSSLEAVSLDKESGVAYAKYADSKVLKLTLAQSAPAKQTEPTFSSEKSDPSLDIPRNKAKAKPESDGREDVNSPEEVRKKSYEKGNGGKNLHTNVIPRDGSGDGLGGKKTTFEKEKADAATSGKPDTYVQKFTPEEKPTAAGNKDNHTASAGNTPKLASDGIVNLSLVEAGKVPPGLQAYLDKNKKPEGKDEEKDEKPDDKSPFDKKKGDDDKKGSEKKDDSKDKKAEADLEIKLAEAQQQITRLEKELQNRKLAEARREAAIGLVLAYRDRSTNKYATAESFNEKVTEIAKKMSVESIDNALSEFNSLVESEAERQKTVLANNKNNFNGISTTAVVFPQETYKFANVQDKDNLSSLFMKHTTLGKQVTGSQKYNEENKEN